MDGAKAIKNISSNKAKAIRRKSLSYRLTDQHLLYVEKGGETAKCLLPEEVYDILAWAHNEHGHFSIVITLHKLKGQWYWPLRVSDVEAFCRTCHTCQMSGPQKKSTITQSIITFQLMLMVGMDFLGPITLICQATGSAYILMVVNYFTQFIWAKGYARADQAAVHDFWMGTIAPFFGFPSSIYMDNGTHF